MDKKLKKDNVNKKAPALSKKAKASKASKKDLQLSKKIKVDKVHEKTTELSKKVKVDKVNKKAPELSEAKKLQKKLGYTSEKINNLSGSTKKLINELSYTSKELDNKEFINNDLKNIEQEFQDITDQTREFSKKFEHQYVEKLLDNYNKSHKQKYDGKYLAEVQDLVLSFKDSANPNKKKLVIRNTSINVKAREVHAIIGESGSGKSVISSSMFGLLGQNAIIESGKIIVQGKEVQTFSQKQWEKSKLRGGFISAVFQNPMTTLNPTMKIGKQIMEGLLINKIVKNKKDAYRIALYYLDKTRINNPKAIMNMYPHELSGGMKQRVVISAIVACQPSVIVFDEPTTALDPTIQAEIIEIIRDLIQETNMGVIFITHDIGVVASISDRISIMYAGQVVETGTSAEILFNPKHPYTWGLLLSMPDINQSDRLTTIQGAVPGSLNDIVGDAFAPRNDFALGIDLKKEPPFIKVSNTHYAKTWLLDPKAEKVKPPLVIQNRWDKFKKMNGGR